MNTHLEQSVLAQCIYDERNRKHLLNKIRADHFFSHECKLLFNFFQVQWINDINQSTEMLMPKLLEKGLLDIFLDIERIPVSNNFDRNVNYLIKEFLDFKFNLAVEQKDFASAYEYDQQRKKVFIEDNAFYTEDQINEELRDLIINGLNIQVYKTGIIDEYYQIIKNQTTIITGIPSSGKSNFVDAICVNLAYKYDWKIMMFSPENQPIKLHLSNIARKYVGEPVMGSKKEINTTWINEHFTFINSNTIDHSLDLLLELVQEKCPDLFVIDPWNEINIEGENNKRFISESLSKIKSMTYKLNMHCFIVAHPTKLRKAEKGDYSGYYPPATAYDIDGAAEWYNKPDNIISLWRNFDNGEIEVHIQKIKFEQVTGKRGMKKLKFVRETGEYI